MPSVSAVTSTATLRLAIREFYRYSFGCVAFTIGVFSGVRFLLWCGLLQRGHSVQPHGCPGALNPALIRKESQWTLCAHNTRCTSADSLIQQWTCCSSRRIVFFIIDHTHSSNCADVVFRCFCLCIFSHFLSNTWGVRSLAKQSHLEMSCASNTSRQ